MPYSRVNQLKVEKFYQENTDLQVVSLPVCNVLVVDKLFWHVISEVIPNICLIARGGRHEYRSERIHAMDQQDVGSWISQKIKGKGAK